MKTHTVTIRPRIISPLLELSNEWNVDQFYGSSDHPANPTTNDLIREMVTYGNKNSVLEDWGLGDMFYQHYTSSLDVYVDGIKVEWGDPNSNVLNCTKHQHRIAFQGNTENFAMCQECFDKWLN